MRVVDPQDLPEPEAEHFAGFTARTVTVMLEIGPRARNMLVFWSLIFVGLVVGGVIG